MNNDLISLFDIPKIKVSVDTFWFFKHCMKDNYFNAHIMIRMLAIDCYYGKNDYGWDWYNKMQLTRVADNLDLCQVFRHIFLKDVIDRI